VFKYPGIRDASGHVSERTALNRNNAKRDRISQRNDYVTASYVPKVT